MEFPKWFSPSRNFRFIAICFIILAFSGCKKSTSAPKLSPEEANQNRLEWNLKTTVEAYDKVGDVNSSWDEPAKRALTEFARSRAPGLNILEDNWPEIIRTNCIAAVDAGCNDPLIRYLYIRFAMPQNSGREQFFDAFSKMEDSMNNSGYPAIRKCYAAVRTFHQMFITFRTSSDPATVQRLEDHLMENLVSLVQDKTVPPVEIYEVCHDALEELEDDERYEDFYRKIEPAIFQNWSGEDGPWLLKGEAYTKIAWIARGSGYNNTVSKEGWENFRKNLSIAEESLNHAWKLNSQNVNIPIAFLTVTLGQGGGRERIELWFQRAMAIDPNCYEACWRKLYYLEPKWYGSAEAMLDFGRECAQSTEWGGHVPLILMNTHRELCGYLEESEQTNYWKRPEVWNDLKMAFDRFFELNPDEVGWYHNYVWYAYQAEQWDKLNELIPKLGTINYSYFGGADEFEKMVQLAKEHAKK